MTGHRDAIESAALEGSCKHFFDDPSHRSIFCGGAFGREVYDETSLIVESF